MTQIYNDLGQVIPCTIVDVSEVYVVDKKTVERDGYEALVLGKGKKKKESKTEKKKYKSIKFVPRKVVEFRKEKVQDMEKFEVGKGIEPDAFKVGDVVNVLGVTKGKGFQGVVKRWRFKGGPRTHGQSDRERAPGSIGGGTDPGRVYKGKKMPGHMGNRNKTIMNLQVVKVDKENKVICIKGAVPGARGGFLKVYKTN